MFSHLSKVSQLESCRSRIPARTLTPVPVRFTRRASHFPYNLILIYREKALGSGTPLSDHGDFSSREELWYPALAPLERTFLWRKQTQVEFSWDTSTRIPPLVFQVVPEPRGLVLWIEVCLPERYIEVPGPEPVNMTSFGDAVFADVIKLRSSWIRVGSNPYD